MTRRRGRSQGETGDGSQALTPALTAPSKLELASKLLFGFTIFLSAFLLFQVQLLMGKYLLPWFGGAPAVWTTCLLFYQSLLLAGYAYAHLLAGRLRGAGQVRLHALLLGTSVLAMALLWRAWPSPITPGPEWQPTGEHPVRSLLAVLGISIGLPFFLLSTTGPLLQHWFSRASGGSSPYPLYAVSNLGSLLGLATYPFLLEPLLRVKTQAGLWSGMYALFAGSAVACGWLARKGAKTPAHNAEDSPQSVAEVRAPSGADRLLWFSLAACGSLMLLSTTNLITQDVASVPLLWALPLGIYLLSFVVTFESGNLYHRGIAHPAFAIATVLAVILLFRSQWTEVNVQIYVFSLTLFATCLVCHGELARLKPAPEYLTSFYLSVAAGGAAGGVLVVLFAPLVFTAYWEYQLSLWLAALLLMAALWHDRLSWLWTAPRWVPMALVVSALLIPEYLVRARMAIFDPPAIYWYRGLVAALALATGWMALRDRNRPAPSRSVWPRAVTLFLLVLLSYALLRQALRENENLVDRSRSFYGVLTVEEENARSPYTQRYDLLHGRITHGNQLVFPDFRRTPTSYYNPQSGAGLALRYNPKRRMNPEPGQLRVGVVGLGVGTLAAYSQPGDYFRFYEINPGVIELAGKRSPYFSYLHDARGRVDIVLGDARLSLASEAARGERQQFDLLFLDAFTSDAVPVHLLTEEAFALYLEHLEPDGILAINISNRTLDFEPLMAAIAARFGLYAVLLHAPGRGEMLESDWVLLSRDPGTLEAPPIAATARPLRSDASVALWTDDYSNLLALLK